MEQAAGKLRFSVVIPTRDRPELFSVALASVLQQSFEDLEVVVVNDGSSDENWSRYQTIEALKNPRVTVVSLPRRPQGHGPSYAINSGAARARGDYLCFLDDDDEWIDGEHLDRAARWIQQCAFTPDTLYTNQHAYKPDGSRVGGKLWLNRLADHWDGSDAGEVTVETLLAGGSFPHLNCTIIRRALFEEIQGFDDGIRYECETDLYLRTLDRARHLLYAPAFVGRHNVPEGSGRNSESTAVDRQAKYLSQVRVYTKSFATAAHPAIRDVSRRRLGDVYRNMAQHCHDLGEARRAFVFARQAGSCRGTLRWAARTCLLGFQALGSKR